ncbi:hypothetical protein [Roseateles sp. P5_D6]
MQRSLYRRLALALACAAFLPLAQAAPVSSAGGLTDFGLFAAGSYTLMGSGTVDVCGGGSALIRPDGSPAATITCPPLVASFNPNGSYTADDHYGRAGLNARIGALIGTLNAGAFLGTDPSAAQADDWFLIGDMLTLTLATAGHIYASVNDTFYRDNFGAFDLRVEAVSGIPEPASVALVAVAMGGLGAAGRRRVSASAPAARLSGQG